MFVGRRASGFVQVAWYSGIVNQYRGRENDREDYGWRVDRQQSLVLGDVFDEAG
jgi:hypothetical protein